jgi:hypothetical protein
MDNALIEKLLKGGEVSEALNVYLMGAFSRSYAVISFGSEGLPNDIPDHSLVTGTSTSGGVIKGMTLEPSKLGAKSVRIFYQNPDNHRPCYVGGNPTPTLDGCKFALITGSKCFCLSTLSILSKPLFSSSSYT